MAPSLVQSATSTSSSSSLTVTFNSATTAGNCVIVAVMTTAVTTNPEVSGITLGGSAGNFSSAVAEGSGSSATYTAIWADPDCAGGETSIVISTTGASGTIQMAATAYEFSGLAASAVTDQTSGALDNSASATWSSGTTATTSQASEVAVGAVASFSSTTLDGPSSPWVNTAPVSYTLTGYDILSSEETVTYNGSFSPSAPYSAAVATFKAAASNPVVATWYGSYSRQPAAFALGPPPCLPLAVQIGNTAGNWLFAVVSWRQDAGIAGDLQYPSTVVVSDDAHNFWIPVCSGVPGTGITRCAVWMAPAARAAEYVYVSPDAWQTSLTVLVAEVTAACPWYEVTATQAAYTNQGTSVTLSQTATSGQFALAVIAADQGSAAITTTATGWTPLGQVTTGNGAAGAFIDVNLGSWTSQLAVWTGLGLTSPSASRYYLSESVFTYDANMQEMVAAGVKICLTVRPAYDPLSSADLASLGTLLEDMQTAGAAAEITLWHEPASTMTQAQFQSMIAYYGPTVRKYYPLVFVTSVENVNLSGENNYFVPGAFDKCATDFYNEDYTNKGYDLSLPVAPANTSVPPLPFGIWECNSSTDPEYGFDSAEAASFFTYIQDFMTARIAAGYINADVLFFNDGAYNEIDPELDLDPGFESGVSGWDPVNCTVTQSSAHAHTGTYSAQLESSASGNMSLRSPGGTSGIPVSGSTAYTCAAWYYAGTDARSCEAGIAWYDSSGTLISDAFGSGTDDSSSGWTQVVNGNVTSPSNAAYAQLVFQVQSTGAASEVHYLDDVLFGATSFTSTVMGYNFGSDVTSDFRISQWNDLASALASSGEPAGLTQLAWYTTTTGDSQPVSGTVAATMDLAEVIVAVSGVEDARAFPYGDLALEGWPALVTQVASGPVLNENPLFTQAPLVTPGAPYGAVSGSGSGTSQAITLTADIAAGDLIFTCLRIGFDGTTCTGASDTSGLTWTVFNGANQYKGAACAWAQATTALPSGTTVTLTLSGSESVTYQGFAVPCYGQPMVADVTAAAGSGTAVSSLSVPFTPAFADEIAFGVAMTSESSGVTTSWTLAEGNGSLGSWYYLPSETAQDFTVSMDPAAEIDAMVVTFRANTIPPWTAWAAGSVSAASWPQWNPWPDYGTVTGGCIEYVPPGNASYGGWISGLVPVSQGTLYDCQAWVYSPGGFGSGTVGFTDSGAYTGIVWYNSSQVATGTLTTNQIPVPAATWTKLTLAAPVTPPEGAAYAAVNVVEWGGGDNPVPGTAVLYGGYCGIGVATSYENIPPDQTTWTDFSARAYDQASVEIDRGIQYEQQSLEAGTMSVTLQNSDGELSYGNILSAYWPGAGDTDIPVRLIAVWPGSVTPWNLLFTGYTDDLTTAWDADWYGYVTVQASDAWSRLTQQMLACALEDVLEDNPTALIPCNLSGANLALTGVTTATAWAAIEGAGAATSTFQSSAVDLLGAQGIDCWQVSGVTSPNEGIALGFYPPVNGPDPMPPVADGITVEFWMNPTEASASQPAYDLTLCTCWGQDQPLWTITISNVSGPNDSDGYITVYDASTGDATTTGLTDSATFLGTDQSATSYFFAVTFNSSSLTVYYVEQEPGLPNSVGTPSVTTVSCNLAPVCTGLSFAGNAGAVFFNNTGGTEGMMNLAVYGIAVFPQILPAARLCSHCNAALNAFPSEPDTWRLARITGYSGFVIPLGMRGLDLPPSGADLDVVTAATDTNGQVASDYYTNIASSTLAAMFTDGAGVLQYRRRLEWYDRKSPQWVLGEYAAVPLNVNGSFTGGTTGWTAGNGATLTVLSNPAGAPSPVFNTSGWFTGNGSTAAPYVTTATSEGYADVTAGEWYAAQAWAYSPQGWASGLVLEITWYTSALSVISATAAATTVLVAGSLTWLGIPQAQAPASAVYAALTVTAQGTPADTVLFAVSGVSLALLDMVAAGGAGSAQSETPYMPDISLSADRTLLYNQTILTQYGTDTNTTYQGTSLVFTPTSGITVQTVNQPSVNIRGGVPYVATIYVNNTVQALPYYLNDASMEDFGNWIVQTLGAPLFRVKTAKIMPVATPEAAIMGFGCEVGDTVTIFRRPIGAAAITMLAYCSKVSQEISAGKGTWNVTYELSPAPQLQALACDDPVHGTLTGGSYLGW